MFTFFFFGWKILKKYKANRKQQPMLNNIWMKTYERKQETKTTRHMQTENAHVAHSQTTAPFEALANIQIDREILKNRVEIATG